MAAVNREAAPGCERHAPGADGSFALELSEENKRLVFRHQRRRFVWMGGKPSPYRPQRDCVAIQLTTVDEHAADAAVRVAVARREPDPHFIAIPEVDPPRTLDMEEKRVNGVVDPCDYGDAASERAGLDLRSAWIRPHSATFDPPGDAATPKVRSKLAEIDRHEIGRPTVDRHGVSPAAFTCARQERLVVPGE